MQADLICVGNELLTGLVENSNAGFLAGRLWSTGIEVRESIVVADDWNAIKEALERALDNSDITLITGGLGPTEDDLTREAVAKILGLKLVVHQEWLEKIEGFFNRRGIKMPDNNIKQAMIIEGSRLLYNHSGTAPGSIIEKDGRVIVMLPGPPNELRPMFEEQVLPYLSGLNRGNISRVKTLKCCGIGESRLEDIIKNMGGKDLPPLSYVARGFEVHLQVKGRGSANEIELTINKAETRLRELLGDNIYGSEDDTLATTLAKLLINRGSTLSVAESCSGGLLSDTITDVPGSSAFYRGGVVAYTKDAKIKNLGLDKTLLDREGMVSEATAGAMAERARIIFQTDMAIGITGLAGPEGDGSGKPVGLVYIAVNYGDETRFNKLNLGGGRRVIKMRAVQLALDTARRLLLDAAKSC